MKLLGFEDIIAGIIVGFLMISYSAKYFPFTWAGPVLKWFLFVFIAVVVFDIIHELMSIHHNIPLTLFAVGHDLVGLVIGFMFLVHFFAWKLPFISGFVGLLSNPANIFICGCIVGGSYIIWALAYPFLPEVV